MFKGSEGLGHAARRALSGARRAGPGARRAVRRRAGREPGSGRGTAQCRAAAAVGAGPTAAGRQSRRVQRRRGRSGRAEGPARGGAVRRPAGRFRARRPAPIMWSRGRAAWRRASAWRSVQATWCGARSTSRRAVLRCATKPFGAATPAAGELVSYRVERLDGAAPEVITTSRATPVLVLPGGRYRVEGRYGAMNARTVRDIEVKRGPDAAADPGAPGRGPEAASGRQRRSRHGGRPLGHPG